MASRMDSGGAFTALSFSPSVTIYPMVSSYYIMTGPATTTLMVGSSTELELQAYDQFGNLNNAGPYENYGGTDVIFYGIDPSPDETPSTVEDVPLGDYTPVTFASGTSLGGSFTFTPTRVGTYVLHATDGTLTTESHPDAERVFQVTQGAASRLNFTEQPSDAEVNTLIDPAPAVSITDQFGNIDVSSTADIAVSFGENPSSATLSGSLTRSPEEGISTYSDIAVSAEGAGYTLVASALGSASATSSPFSVIHHPPTFLDSAAGGQQYANTLTISKAFASTGTHQYLFYVFAGQDGEDVSSVTWGGTPMTSLNMPSAFNGKKIYVYGLANPDVSSMHDGVVTMSAGYVMDGALLLYAGASSTQLDAIGSEGGAGSGSVVDGVVTTTSSNADLLLVLLDGMVDEDPVPEGGAVLRAAEHGEATGLFAVMEEGPFADPGEHTISSTFTSSGHLFASFGITPAE